MSFANKSNGTETPLPETSKAYGTNILTLRNTTTAVLDAPQPPYLRAIQNTLTLGESWNVTVSVKALVTTYDTRRDANYTGFQERYNNSCVTALLSSWAVDFTIGGVALLSNGV